MKSGKHHLGTERKKMCKSGSRKISQKERKINESNARGVKERKVFNKKGWLKICGSRAQS